MSITYLEAIREAQAKLLRDNEAVFIYGQDVGGTFGGAFKATKGLAKEFPGRVLNTPISEDAMVGTAIGAAMHGMRPIVEMQFADFSSTALNQILNNAGTHYWRTDVPVPITVRLPSGGTKGSGPFHSQSMESVYAHYPGLIVMTPATVEDAHSMLIEAVAIGDSCPCGGATAEIIARVTAEGFHLPDAAPQRLNARDTPIPYHPNLWSAHRPNAKAIARKVRALLRE